MRLELLGDNIYCPYDMQTKIYVIGTQHENNFIFNAMINKSSLKTHTFRPCCQVVNSETSDFNVTCSKRFL